MNKVQQSFRDGINLLSDDTNIDEYEYIWLINGRQRYGYIEPTKKNLLVNAPDGKKQAIIAVGNILVLFVAGRAYYREDGTTQWIQIPSFLMSTTAPRFYVETVPASTFDYVRKLDTGLSIHAPIRATTDFKVSGTPAGIIVQDTINQPWIIEYDPVNQIFTSRITHNYGQWSNTSLGANDREYVPVGKQMMYKDGVLYIVAKDGKSVYRSVTGRPLDFMINVDVNGHKLATESLGGAQTTAFAMDFDEITCLSSIDVPGSFIYGTKRNTRIVTTDFTTTIFGEPLFSVSANIQGTGINNQFSVAQSLNDFVFISTDTVKAFNAVQQLKFRGNSAIFTKQLSRLLFNAITRKPIKQVDCSCIGFQNYILFNLDTFWGNLIAVWDDILQKWVSLDITTATRIKQYALLDTTLETKLYCITEYDEVFQLYGSTQVEIPQLRVRGYTTEETDIEHKSVTLRPFFQSATFDGECFVTEFVDDQLSGDFSEPTTDYRYRHPLPQSIAGVPFPVIPPVIPSNVQKSDCPGFTLTKGLTGKKISFILSWTNDAQLMELQLVTSEQKAAATLKQKNLTYQQTYGSNS